MGRPGGWDCLRFEREAALRGYRCIAGVDEAGRGPLAGPVVAAAVVLPEDADLPGVRDSKQLPPARREECFMRILAVARAVSVGCVEPSGIAHLNILGATFAAMTAALAGLAVTPDLALIDGPYHLPVAFAQSGIPQGDARSLSIASASIVAKVHRDAIMTVYDALYPGYGFARHKGYGTEKHLAALRRHGPCPIHRLGFRGVLSGE